MSELDETIERVAAQIADADPNDESAADMVPCGDLRALLAAARRVVAMDSTESPVIGRALNALDCDMARASDGVLFAQIQSDDLRTLLDLASDQFAARARVRELEARIAILETNNARLTEVSMTRLRALQALNQPDPAIEVEDV